MPVVPLLRPREVVRGFACFGWQVVRQPGSHMVMTKPGAVAILSIPEHSLVARGTLRALIGRAGLTIEEFLVAVGL